MNATRVRIEPGCRIGEALALTVERVVLETRAIVFESLE